MSSNPTIAYHNGSWVPWSDVRIDPNDRGFLTADAVFDAARTFNGEGFQLKAHVDRLYRSLHITRMDPGISADEMLTITMEAIERNEEHRAAVGDFQVWQGVTRGAGRWAYDAGVPNVYVKVSPVDFGRYGPHYEKGARAVVTRTQSLSYGTVDPKLKTYSRMHFNLAELEAGYTDPGAWPVLVDSIGNLTEGSGYNLFIVSGGRVITPPSTGVLPGISRQYAIDIAKRLGLMVDEVDIQPFDLYSADEAFFTGTSPCILPVTVADGLPIGSGLPGPITQQMLGTWSEDVGVDIATQAVAFTPGM
ncbi:MAG: aminotransferase class IV [Actinomycetota bacterium]|nr:aminotransferase class IV [Actinomycetota bacterium]